METPPNTHNIYSGARNPLLVTYTVVWLTEISLTTVQLA